MGRDQPMVAERVVAVGAGRSLDPDADAATIGHAVSAALADPRLRHGAEAMASVIARADGATTAAAQLLAMLGSQPPAAAVAR